MVRRAIDSDSLQPSTTIRRSGITRIGWPNLDISFPIPDPAPDTRNRTTGPGTVLVSGANTRWSNTGGFVVGGYSDGSLVVEDGAVIDTARFEILGNYNDFSNSAQFTGAGARLESEGSLSVGRRGILNFEHGATFPAGLLSIFGRTSLSGPNVAGTIDGLSTAVHVFAGGELNIEGGADLTTVSTRNTIGSGDDDPPLALVRLSGDGTLWDAGLSNIHVAINAFGEDRGNGELLVGDGAIVRANQRLIGTGGMVSANRGILEADVFVLGGQLLPGQSPGLLTIDGDLSADIDSTVEIEIAGITSVDNYDVVDVTGNVDVKGRILLKFINGFTPTAGEQYEFLTAQGTIDLADAEYEVQGLQPGFEFEIMPTANGMQVLALNDGVSSVPEPSSLALFGWMFIIATQHSSPDISSDSSRGGLSHFVARHVRLATAGVLVTR